jgi:hypothetical protein
MINLRLGRANLAAPAHGQTATPSPQGTAGFARKSGRSGSHVQRPKTPKRRETLPVGPDAERVDAALAASQGKIDSPQHAQRFVVTLRGL